MLSRLKPPKGDSVVHGIRYLKQKLYRSIPLLWLALVNYLIKCKSIYVQPFEQTVFELNDCGYVVANIAEAPAWKTRNTTIFVHRESHLHE